MNETIEQSKFWGGAVPHSYDRPSEGYIGHVFGSSGDVAVLPGVYRTQSGARARASQLADVLCELWSIAPFELPVRPQHRAGDDSEAWAFALWAYQRQMDDLGRTLDRLQTNVRQWKFRARQAGSFGVVRLDEWLESLRAVGGCCPSCGNETKLTCDHVQPLVMGGPNWADNVQALCRSCNARKGRKSTRFVPVAAFATEVTS